MFGEFTNLGRGIDTHPDDILDKNWEITRVQLVQSYVVPRFRNDCGPIFGKGNKPYEGNHGDYSQSGGVGSNRGGGEVLYDVELFVALIYRNEANGKGEAIRDPRRLDIHLVATDSTTLASQLLTANTTHSFSVTNSPL